MNDLFQYIDKLPCDILINNIYPNLSAYVFVTLNKINYIKYHDVILLNVTQKDINSYIRFILKNDLSFVFQQIVNTNLNISIINDIYKSKYFYKNNTFNNNYDFYNYYCIQYNSNKCRNIITDRFSSLYGKNSIKKLKQRI